MIKHFKTPYKSVINQTALTPKAGAIQSYLNKKPVSKPFIPGQPSQRASYAKAMNRAQKNGGSNGIGVGY